MGVWRLFGVIFIKAAVLPQEKVSESERDGVALLQPLTYTHARRGTQF